MNKQTQEKIKLYCIILNGGLNLATPNKETAITRLSELMNMIQNINKCKNWKIEVSYN